jgi:hypothetical protein
MSQENENFERRRFLDTVNPKYTIIYDVIMTIVIRAFVLAQSIFAIYFLVSSTLSYSYLALIIFLVAIAADTVFVIVWRKGKEYLWLVINFNLMCSLPIF